ncbi:MAG: methionine adenosyltransferase [Candidatus Aenigmarchaeota archaeon]|nr:methionine adenosyltransferase [Candidatus Aenigmarchaeota archaeon]
MNIIVESLTRQPIEQQKVEMVERKGIGHPDSLSDGMAEAVSRALCKEYLKRYGVILHHNTDKLEIVGGEATATFGGGEILRPIYVMLSGRATMRIGSEEIPVHEVAVKAARDYMRNALPHLEQDDAEFDSRIGMGSIDLREMFDRKNAIPGANDTSFGVSFAPLSETERLVLSIEQLLNSGGYKKRHPELGQDIKVMGLRKNHAIILTVAGAFLSRLTPDFGHYVSVKEEIVSDIKDYVAKNATRETDVYLNTADNYEKKVVYLTLTGTSAEAGDDGCVGRGNRVNGLITPNREMSLEAAAGKNPVSHVGKLYNVLAQRIADRIHRETQSEVYVKLLSQIGRPITDPLMASVEIESERYDKSSVEAVVQEELENITGLQKLIVEDGVRVF